MRKLALLITMFLTLAIAARGDDFTDPATLHIGPGGGTTCAKGCAGDPNQVGLNQVDIYQNSSGAGTLSVPVLLIIGIPNDTTNLFASNPISSVTWYNPYPSGTPGTGSSAFASAGTFGLKSATSGGFFGDLTSGKEVYSFLSLNQPADNSNSFGNWAAADSTINGVTASDFGIYVFALTGGALGADGLVNVDFLNNLPSGSIVVAYGEYITTDKHGTHTMIYDTPFTEAGDATAVPEPGSLMLLGTGLLSLGGVIRRRFMV